MTPRGTDWSLAALVALLVFTGVLTLFAGRPGEARVFVAHDAGGAALALLVVWKLRRVGRRVVHPRGWDRRTAAGLTATGLVLAALGSGIAWSSGAELYLAGFGLAVSIGHRNVVLAMIDEEAVWLGMGGVSVVAAA